MKKAVLFSAIGVLAASFGQVAGAQESGRVVSSTPVIQQVAVPRQVCGAQPVAQGSGGGAVVGAIVGGLLGNTIGHGMGRAAATGIGAVAGAGIGSSVGSNTQYAQQCTTQTTYENRTVGYNVVYEYGGKQYTTQMAYDPGQNVNLQVTPVGGNAQGVITAPPLGQNQAGTAQPAMAAPSGQPVAVIVPTQMAYPVTYAAPYYYGGYGYAPSYYYPPVSLSLGFGYSRGWGGGWGGHHHHGHWR
ncbi:glycine zipper 2TM domain-containing protein [Caenimonas aquaedulcis]|uniref:Glycine zipper 2TM domain-containing protein n=1 Tax=Caenimonas aquaedulcis TaxID=2793270 RepID=A0A931MIS1_9BURK|nr:glycine zipper 2TM domain-containing protein [Caenimonas aquaedulcis]MBG9390033.1 hypothetical protein [Caenimonas aquaedulcis]